MGEYIDEGTLSAMHISAMVKDAAEKGLNLKLVLEYALQDIAEAENDRPSPELERIFGLAITFNEETVTGVKLSNSGLTSDAECNVWSETLGDWVSVGRSHSRGHFAARELADELVSGWGKS